MKNKSIEEMVSLLDGVSEIVEIFKTDSIAQEVWKRDWLKRANKIMREYES